MGVLPLTLVQKSHLRLGVDEREDKPATFCLVTAMFFIGHYCKRWFLRKRHLETIEYSGDLYLPLRVYPVVKLLAAFSLYQQDTGGTTG